MKQVVVKSDLIVSSKDHSTTMIMTTRSLPTENVLIKKRGRSALGLLLLVSLPALCHGFSASTGRHSVTGIAASRTSRRTAFRSSKSHPLPVQVACSVRLGMSSQVDEPTTTVEQKDESPTAAEQQNGTSDSGMLEGMSQRFQEAKLEWTSKRPPVQVDDTNLMFYDVFLIVNLVVSISFWVTHRMDFSYLVPAISEGSLLSVLWMASGLYTGAFLYSAVDGHYATSDERAGPRAAGLLGFHTFLNTVNLRLVVALLMAVAQHRPVGSGLGEDLLPLEIGFGFVLMSCWRILHSSSVPRL